MGRMVVKRGSFTQSSRFQEIEKANYSIPQTGGTILEIEFWDELILTCRSLIGRFLALCYFTRFLTFRGETFE